MALRVFLSYSLDRQEMPLAWRLQTLAAAHGVEMIVPPLESRAFDEKARNSIDRADCVLALITMPIGDAAKRELQYALEQGKPVVPILSKDVARPRWLGRFPQVFTYSPATEPGAIENEIAEFLKQHDLTKDQQRTLAALVALGLGMLTLAEINRA